MKKSIIPIVLATLLVVTVGAAQDRAMLKTADGSQSVHTGDSVGKLLDIHGRPDYEETGDVYVKTRSGMVRKNVSYWYYRIETGTSAGKATYRVTVYNGKISRIEDIN
jgi:hypothetical protein